MPKSIQFRPAVSLLLLAALAAGVTAADGARGHRNRLPASTTAMQGPMSSQVSARAKPAAAQPDEAKPQSVQSSAHAPGLCLVVDERKVLGWISADESFTGREVAVATDDRHETVIVQHDNTFTWHYKLKKPATVTFSVAGLERTETLHPRAPSRPTALFIVERTAYRPLQTLHFAALLREPDASGEFVPLAGREVGVRLVSRRKKTAAAVMKLVADDFGRLTGQYEFTAADPLDVYDLGIEGFAGSAEVTLAEFRKAKVRLKIDSKLDGPQLQLTFQALDFLEQPVPGSSVRFTAQVVRPGPAGREFPLDARAFVYHDPASEWRFDPTALSEERQLLWKAGHLPPWAARETGPVVLAQREADLTLDAQGYAEHALDLDAAWLDGHCAVLVEGVLVDYNGHEQRAARRIPLQSHGTEPGLELQLPKQSFTPGEPICVRLAPRDGKLDPRQLDAAVMAMRLTCWSGIPLNDTHGALGQLGAMPGMQFQADQFMGAQFMMRSARPYPRAAHAVHPRYWQLRAAPTTTVVRKLATATVARAGEAVLSLDRPGAYKLVGMVETDDGSKLVGEAGLVVRPADALPGLTLQLDRDVIPSGDALTGGIESHFTGARVLLCVRDSRGVRFWRPYRLDGTAVQIEERLPKGLRYGCSVEAFCLDANGRVHAAAQPIRVVPRERILTVGVETKEVYSPGEEVQLDLEVNRREPVDLVVSVYDQSLLGVSADRSVDPRQFYLADERALHTAGREHLRARLAGVTLKELVERAEKTLSEAPKTSETPREEAIRRTVANYRGSRIANCEDIVVLLHLAGIEAGADPRHAAYFGRHWYHRFDAAAEEAAPARLFDVLAAERDGWRLDVFLPSNGPALVAEYHPQHTAELASGIQHFGQQWMPNRYIGGRARGDSHFSASANAMYSDMMVSGQAFISHLPSAVAEPIALIDADAPGVAVRRDFSDAAYWNARVRTGADGKATVRFKLPDSLTNWRVAVTAVSRKMHVGQAKSSFRTYKPVMVWPLVPRIFTVGDHVELFATVHNRTDEEQEIDVALKVDNGVVHTPKQLCVRVPAGEQAPVYWTFEPKEAGFAQLLMTARCSAGSDASLKRLPVSPLMAEQAVTLSGECKGTAVLKVPNEARLEQASLEIVLVPSLADDLVQSLGYLVEYPHGCVEQTMSRFLPAIKVAQTLRRADIRDPELEKKLPGVVEAGIKRLLELQQPDGGWAWQQKGQTHEMMTPYALYGLLEAEAAGYAVPQDEAVEQGLARLRHFIDAMGEDQSADRIYCAYVYSHRHAVPDAVWEAVGSQLEANRLSDYSLALSLEMALGQGKRELADQLAAGLAARARRSDGEAYWTTADFSRWGADPLEITAAALKALVAHDPEDELIPDVLAYFARTKQGDRWNSTKATAMILYALCDYMATQDHQVGKPGTLRVSIGGGKPHVAALHPGTRPVVQVPGMSLRHGENVLRFEGHAPGAMYRAVFRYWKTGRDIPPMQSGLAVRRQFFLLGPDGQQVREIQPGDAVPRGSYLAAAVTTSDQEGRPMRYVLVENPKPSCCEILPETDSRFNQSSTSYALREDKTAGVVWHHEETGSQIVNRCVFHTELAGQYAVPPAEVELMYEPATRGHSGTFFFRVEDSQP